MQVLFSFYNNISKSCWKNLQDNRISNQEHILEKSLRNCRNIYTYLNEVKEETVVTALVEVTVSEWWVCLASSKYRTYVCSALVASSCCWSKP